MLKVNYILGFIPSAALSVQTLLPTPIPEDGYIITGIKVHINSVLNMAHKAIVDTGSECSVLR